MKTTDKLYLEQHTIVDSLVEEYNWWLDPYKPTPMYN